METATHQGSLISFSKKWNYRSNLCMSICMNAGARKIMKKNMLWANSMIELEKLSFHIMISYRYLKFNFKFLDITYNVYQDHIYILNFTFLEHILIETRI